MKKKILTALLSLMISFGLWLYVITVVSPNSTNIFYNIPVILNGESVLTERELMITSVPSKEVTLKLEGNRSDLIKLDRSNIDIVVDLTKIYTAGTYKLRFDVGYPGDVRSDAFTILEQDPVEITVEVEKRKSSSVPVKIDYMGAVPAGFVADKENAVLDYNKITITGPESVVSQVAEARIEVDLTDLTESIIGGEYRYTLCDGNGKPVDAALITTNTTEIRLDLKVQRMKEIKLVAHIIEGGGATVKNSTVKLTPETIQISGSEAALEQLATLEIGEINLGAYEKDTILTFSLEGLLPEGVTNLTGVTEVQAEISFANLKIKELSLTDIRCQNVPEGMQVELLTQALNVKIRGAAGQIDKLTADDITVLVDFTGASVGTTTVKAQIVLDERFKDVGEMGTYSVYAELQEADKTG